MKVRIAMAAAAAAALGVVLGGCTQTASAPAITQGASVDSPELPPSCHQQYGEWKQAVKPEAAKLEAALKRVEAAGNAEDIPQLTSALRQSGRVAVVLSRSPMPGCADPHGYYRKMLARITAAGDNAKAGTGLGALVLAEAPLETVPGIEKKLTAELSHTVGKH